MMEHSAGERAADATITATGLRKRYGKREVVRGISFTLRAGELVALLGPNGSGKTTLMSILVGLMDPDEGQIARQDRWCGWVPQGLATYARLTVRENLELFASLLRLPGDPADHAARAAERVGLTPWIDNEGTELSGGVRQRLNIAIGLYGDPRLLVLDEPTTGVDLYHRQAMWQILRERADRGGTVLYSTHSLEDAGLADRVCMIAHGGIVYDGPLEGLAAHAVVGSYPAIESDIARGMLALWDVDAASGAVVEHG